MAESGSKRYNRDAFIYIESDEDSAEVFIVESGEVVLQGTPGMPMFRQSLGPGDIFGFTSCLCRRPRMETAVARTDCTCVVLSRDKFLERVQSNPDLASRIISYFAQELRAYDNLMTTPSAETAAEDDEVHLFELATHLAKRGRLAHAVHAFTVYADRFPSGPHAAAATAERAHLKARLGETKPPAARGVFKVFADGQMIFCEFEPGNELYVIKSGKVEILKIAPPEEILLSILRDGDIFGELSIVSATARNATAIASGETILMPVSRASLPSLFQKSPAVVARILAALSQRLWFTFIRLRAKAYENPLTRTYVLMENKLLEERISLKGTKPVTLSLGIGEILSMSGVPADQMDAVKNQLASDPNLSFQFRQVTIENPTVLESRAHYLRTRDHLGSAEAKPGTAARAPASAGKTPAPAAKAPAASRPAAGKATPAKAAPGKAAAAAPTARRPAPRIGLDHNELRVPPEKMPED
ncbi:MAG TPA: cyclic nucleotide-binding domain-containing protein [Spirochaetia bacterium]|nr:cyclic nucleotide-binding domain-containing protein [Spirochaetia bacterium]